jgi:hypothetical protein
MPIKKLVPKVPDPYISKNELNQFWPARFGHLDYLIEQINNGGAIPEGFSQIYTELITIPGTVYASVGPLIYNFPANGLSQQLSQQGKFIIPIGFTVGILETVAPPLLPFSFSGMYFNVLSPTTSNNTKITNDWALSTFGSPYPTASYAYVPAIVESGGIIIQAIMPIDQSGQIFQLSRNPGGGGYYGTADNCLKIAFSFQAIDIDWFLKLTN